MLPAEVSVYRALPPPIDRYSLSVPNRDADDGEGAEAVVDMTAPLKLHSKRTERLQKKLNKKKQKRSGQVMEFFDLPLEIFTEVLSYLRPSDVFRLARTNKALNQFILQEEKHISQSIVSWRYVVLEKCFRTPIPLELVDQSIHPALQDENREAIKTMKKNSFQHFKSSDPRVVCTCWTCILRWNILNVAVDFAHWYVPLHVIEG
jgi:hypothetical protein